MSIPADLPSNRARTLASALGIWTIVVVLFAGSIVFSSASARTQVPWLQALLWAGAQWYAWAALSPVIFMLSRRQRVHSTAWARPLAVHAAAAPALAFAHLALERALLLAMVWGASAVPALAGGLVRNPIAPWPLRVQRNFFFGMLCYGVIVLAAHVIDYYRLYQRRELQATRLEAQLADARLRALRAQLQPHFLFNTLSSIAGLVHVDPAAADRMILNLSDLLRRMIEEDEAELSLRRELSLLDAYLGIERERLGDRLRVRMAIEPDALRAVVPALLLQPLVENALQHGVRALEQGGTVELRGRRDGDRLELVVRNDGPPTPLPPSRVGRAGIGLANTRERLRALYGDRCDFSGGHDGSGFTVRVALPWRETRDGREHGA